MRSTMNINFTSKCSNITSYKWISNAKSLEAMFDQYSLRKYLLWCHHLPFAKHRRSLANHMTADLAHRRSRMPPKHFSRTGIQMANCQTLISLRSCLINCASSRPICSTRKCKFEADWLEYVFLVRKHKPWYFATACVQFGVTLLVEVTNVTHCDKFY